MPEFENPDIYRSVLEELPAGVYLVDRHRRIVFWNAGAERICGYLRQDVVGRFLRDHLFATNNESDGNNDYAPAATQLRDDRYGAIAKREYAISQENAEAKDCRVRGHIILRSTLQRHSV